jgi:hypothetical protein
LRELFFRDKNFAVARAREILDAASMKINILPAPRQKFLLCTFALLRKVGPEILHQILEKERVTRLVSTANPSERPDVDLLEQCLDVLALSDPEKALPILMEILKGPLGQSAKVHAALALESLKRKEAIPTLVGALNNEHHFVRYLAYRALKATTGEEIFVNWIYGTPAAIQEAIARWKRVQ